MLQKYFGNDSNKILLWQGKIDVLQNFILYQNKEYIVQQGGHPLHSITYRLSPQTQGNSSVAVDCASCNYPFYVVSFV